MSHFLPVILIIDDEPALQRLLTLILKEGPYKVVTASNAEEGLQQAVFIRPDAIVLDLGLPDMDGKEIIKRLREWSQVPILVVSVRDDPEEKVAALEQGADDYVTKPFDSGEVLARIKAILRRAEPGREEPRLEAGDLLIDFAARKISRLSNGREISLTATEYAILRILARNAGKVVTHQQILRTVWGPHAEEQRQYLRVHMAHLRKKLGPEAALIRTESSIGYRLLTGIS